MDINIPTLVSQTITNGVTAYAPSEDVVFDALALKQPLDADLTSIAGLTGTNSYLRKTSGTTYTLDSYSTVASNIGASVGPYLSSTDINTKLLTGGTFTGIFAPTMSIVDAFEEAEAQLEYLTPSVVIGFSAIPVGQIVVGDATNTAQLTALTLSGTGGTFGLSGTGVLTMPNADTTTRGLLTSTDWNTFNGKQATLVSGTNIKTINGSSVLGSGDLVVGGGLTVGTTTITSGTSTRIIYNNAGVVGEYTLTGSGTAVAMGTSPTFTTNITTPKVIGSTSAGGTLTLISSTNATQGQFLIGGNATSNATSYGFFRINQSGTSTANIDFGDRGSNLPAIWIGQTTNTILNPSVSRNVGTGLFLSDPDGVYVRPGNITGAGLSISSGLMTVESGANLKVFDNAGFGTTVTAGVRVQILSTTEQLRVNYDASNYYSTTVSSAGAVTFNAVGASAGFTFSDNIKLTQTVTTEAVTSDTTVTIVINGTTYKLLAKA